MKKKRNKQNEKQTLLEKIRRNKCVEDERDEEEEKKALFRFGPVHVEQIIEDYHYRDLV